MQPFFDIAPPLEKIKTNRHLSQLRGQKKTPKLSVPQSEVLMYGVKNSFIKEKLGMPMGGADISDLLRQKITF